LMVSLLLSSIMIFPAGAEEQQTYTKEINLSFSAPKVNFDGEFSTLEIDNAYSSDHQAGAPLLPMHSERVYLPANAKDIKVEFTHSDTNTMTTQNRQILLTQRYTLINNMENLLNMILALD